MADLTGKQNAHPTKITGDDESTNVIVTPNKELRTSDIMDNGGSFKSLTVGTSAVELKVGASRLTDRKYVMFQSKEEDDVFYGFSNSVTTSNGIEIFEDQLIMIPVGENTQVWFISGSAGNDVRIAEIA